MEKLDPGRFPVALTAGIPANFKIEGATLNVEPSASASIDVFSGDKARDFFKCLGISNGPVSNLVSFGITAGLDYGPSAQIGDFCFGLTSGQEIAVTSYNRAAGSDTFLDALRKAVSSLTIPHNLDDLRTLPPDSICRIEGKGTVKFTASVQYSFLNNCLASVPLDAISQSLSVKASSGAKLQVAVEHTSGHQLTIARMPDEKLRLSVALSRADTVTAGVSISLGVSATIVGGDALEFIVRQISPSADREIENLRKALPADVRADLSAEIKKVVEGAAAGGIQASLEDTMAKSRETDHLFIYEIDLSALDARSVEAVEAALQGDLTQITAYAANLAGIREISNVLTLTLTTTRTLTIHLIGILNFRDVSTFVQNSKPGLNSETGEVVLTAEEIKAVENRLDPDSLREVLLRSAVITTGAVSSANSPDFTFKMVFFLRKAHPSRSDMQQTLNALRTVGSGDTKNAEDILAGNVKRPGAIAVYLSLDLNKDLSLAAFRNHTTDDYVLAGQSAMKALLSGDKDSEGRLKLASINLNLWNQLRTEGSRANVERMMRNAGITDPAAIVDFFAIDWWAQAMGNVAAALAKGGSLKDAESAALKKSEGGFDVPWALLATYLLLNRQPAVTSQFTCALQNAMKTVTAG